MVKKRISTVFVIYVCFILQSTVFWHIRLAGVVPNLILVVVVLTAYMRGQMDGLITGFLCGLLIDMAYGNLLGLYAVVLMLLGYLVGYANRIYYSDDFTVPLILVGVSNFIYGMAYFIFEFLLRGRTNLPFYLTRIILPEMIYTLVMAVLIFKCMYTLEKWLTGKEKEEA